MTSNASMQHLANARAWATAPEPEAHVCFDRQGEPWIAYVGAESSLLYLESVNGAHYIDITRVDLVDSPHFGTRTYLLLPVSATNLRLLETIGKLKKVDEKYRTLRNHLIPPAAPQWEQYYPETPEGLPTPYRHQKECFAEALAAFGRGAKGFACWLDMGLGKTRLATDLARALRVRVALVLCPKVTVPQWELCLKNGYPDASVIVLTGPIAGRSQAVRRLCKSAHLDQPIVLVLNWDVLYRLVDDLMKLPNLDLVIADEASRLRKRTSQVSKAARKLAKKARWRLPLTGTPMGGDPADLWAQFAFQDERIFGRSFWDYMKRYCRLGGFTGWEFAGLLPDRVPELIEKMYGNAFRATKAMVTDMPPKTYRVVELEPTPEQKRVYKRVHDDYAVSVQLEDGRRGSLSVTSTIARSTRLQQITAGILPLTAIEQEEPDECEEGGSGHVTHQELTSAKTVWCVDYCKELQENSDAHMVIWTRFQAEADRLMRELKLAAVEAALIDGRTKPAMRAQILKSYSDSSDPLRVLVCNITAGAYGLDLPIADVMIYHSNTFYVYDRLQSEDRGHRLGRTRPYQIIDLVLRGTVDEDIQEAVKKRVNFSELFLPSGAKRETATR